MPSPFRRILLIGKKGSTEIETSLRELRDFLAQINPSGRDVNADKVANSGDNTWVSTFMVTGNLVFYLPTTASISQ